LLRAKKRDETHARRTVDGDLKKRNLKGFEKENITTEKKKERERERKRRKKKKEKRKKKLKQERSIVRNSVTRWFDSSTNKEKKSNPIKDLVSGSKKN